MVPDPKTSSRRTDIIASDTSSFGTFSVVNATDVAAQQLETYTLPAPGPVPDRQDVPRLHEAILDPTRQFLLVPDLGSDLVRVYKIASGAATASVKEMAPIKAVPGSGPRHGAFAVAGSRTFFYHVNELSNTISGYTVSYAGYGAPKFTRIFDFSTHGPGGSVPTGTKAAELVVSVCTVSNKSLKF